MDPGKIVEVNLLQWGRRLSTAETPYIEIMSHTQIDASMGPPSLNGGNLRVLRDGPRPRAGFNGAAVSQRRKLVQNAVLERGVRPASMGPPSLNGGNTPLGSRPNCAATSFNGAAVSQRRKLHRVA